MFIVILFCQFEIYFTNVIFVFNNGRIKNNIP